MSPAQCYACAACLGAIALVSGAFAFNGWGRGSRPPAVIIVAAAVCVAALVGAVLLVVAGAR